MEKPVACVFSTPKRPKPNMVKDWNDPTLAGAFGIAGPRCTIKKTANPAANGSASP